MVTKTKDHYKWANPMGHPAGPLDRVPEHWQLMWLLSFTWSLYLGPAKVLIIWKNSFARIALSQTMVPTAYS